MAQQLRVLILTVVVVAVIAFLVVLAFQRPTVSDGPSPGTTGVAPTGVSLAVE